MKFEIAILIGLTAALSSAAQTFDLPRPTASAPAKALASDADNQEHALGTYTYDPAGNITAIGQDTFRYDAVQRLSTATVNVNGKSTSQTFSYDAFGNLVRITKSTVGEAAVPAVVPAADSATNKITNINRCAAGETCIFGSYDLAGNQINANGTYTYSFDPLHMMSELSGAGRHELYVYDANDERVATVKASDWRYTIRGADQKVLREFASSGATWSWKQDWIYRGDLLLASVTSTPTGNVAKHFHLDHLGSPRLITDGTGRRLATRAFLPFGQDAPGSTPHDERMNFTGHERDSAGPNDVNALDYMHARFYGAAGGRFLSVDRAELKRFPQNHNAYSYVTNNPTMLVDPDGLEGIVPEWARGVFSINFGVSAAGGKAAGSKVSINGDLHGNVSVTPAGALGGGLAFGKKYSVTFSYNWGARTVFDLTSNSKHDATLNLAAGAATHAGGLSVGLGFDKKYGHGPSSIEIGWGQGAMAGFTAMTEWTGAPIVSFNVFTAASNANQAVVGALGRAIDQYLVQPVRDAVNDQSKKEDEEEDYEDPDDLEFFSPPSQQ